MKKLFFFRSHSSNNANNNQISPSTTDKNVYWERAPEKVKPTKNKYGSTSKDQLSAATPGLRRSLSFSSGSLYHTGKGLMNCGDPVGSPCSTTSKDSMYQSAHFRTLTPEKQSCKKYIDATVAGIGKRFDEHDYVVSRDDSDLSEVSSYCSSNVSNKVLDRYIDGENQEERCVLKAKSLRNNQSENRNTVVNRPPKYHFASSVSHVSRKQKPKSHSARETEVSKPQLSSDDGDIEYCQQCPRKLAKHVVERLSQSRFFPKMSSKGLEHDNPITIEDVYGVSLNRHSDSYCYDVSPKNRSIDWRTETNVGSFQEEIAEVLEDRHSFVKNDRDAGNDDAMIETDSELFQKFKEAEDRAAILSEELEKENFLQFRGVSMPALIQTIRSLAEERLSMALEVSAVLEDQIAQKALFREKLKFQKADFDSVTQRFEKERNELQLSLEKELDRRSAEWSIKIDKCEAEELRLRERVRELAEQNVCLQQEVSSFSAMEEDTGSKILNLEKQVAELSIQAKDASENNHYLRKTVSELQDRNRSTEEDRDSICRNYEEKVAECTDLHQATSRLQRANNDQERTIEGLQFLCEELGKKNFNENPDFELKIQVEQKRLVGMEHALRKELESCRVQMDSLRHENIYLLNCLKNYGKNGSSATFKLDQELNDRISLLQNQMVPLLRESSLLGRRLVEFVKTSFPQMNKRITSASSLDGHQFLVECEVKNKGLERAAENLVISLKTMSNVIKEKSDMLHEKSYLVGQDPSILGSHESTKQSDQKSEDIIKSKLKAETLLTSLLHEKLYSKEQDVEQLQAELAAAVRCNNALKCEVQNAADDYSCLNHNMKELELKMIKKDETINQLQCDLQECKKELTIVRGILPKVSDERDMMWEEVKQYTEKNMLLNGEINMLKKKIETLDEDILLKEGQISILKDSMGKTFDLLSSPDTDGSFCWTTAC